LIEVIVQKKNQLATETIGASAASTILCPKDKWRIVENSTLHPLPSPSPTDQSESAVSCPNVGRLGRHSMGLTRDLVSKPPATSTTSTLLAGVEDFNFTQFLPQYKAT
jgi:hypothetical protein